MWQLSQGTPTQALMGPQPGRANELCANALSPHLPKLNCLTPDSETSSSGFFMLCIMISITQVFPFLNHPFKQTTNLLPRAIFNHDTWSRNGQPTATHIDSQSSRVKTPPNLLLTYLLQMSVQGPVCGWPWSCCQDMLFSLCSCLSLKYFLCSCMACSSRDTSIPSTQVNIRAFTTGVEVSGERKRDRAAWRRRVTSGKI